MSAVNMLFAPLAGIIVLLRLNSLVTVSDLTLPLLKIMGTLTMAAGIVYFVAVDNIKKKLVYLNMGFIGFLLLLLVKNGFAWSWLCAGYYVAACFFNLLLLKIYLYQNHEVRVSEMLNSRETNSALMNATLMQLILAANVFFAVIWKIAGKFASSGWIWGGGASGGRKVRASFSRCGACFKSDIQVAAYPAFGKPESKSAPPVVICR